MILLILSLQKEKLDNHSNKRDEILKTKNKDPGRKNFGRKLDEGEGETGGGGVKDLSFYFDLFNFNYTFPNETLGEGSKDVFIKAMKNAEEKLQKLITVDVYTGIVFSDTDDYKAEMGIEYWNDTMYDVTDIIFDTFNYIVFFNFLTTINGEASSRIIISYDRPLAGLITFNPEKLRDKISLNYLTTLLFHQYIHLLGFHLDNYNKEDDPIFTGIIQENNDGFTYYITSSLNPKLYDYIRTYFNCPDFDEDIELDKDEDNNIHWPKRFFLGDIMTKFDYPEEQVLSGFTLAFLEDLGTYHVIKNYTGGLMRFGKYKGCQFLKDKCEEEHDNIFGNEFYLPINMNENPDYFEPSCSSGRLSKTVYRLYTTPEGKEEYHEFYSNGIVGKESANFCPISEYDTSLKTNTYIGPCSDINTSKDGILEDKLGEIFSPKSFCVLSSLIKEEYESDLALRSVCYEMECSSSSLTIKIGENYIVCPKQGGKITAENFIGELLCPDFNLICTGTELCNSMFDCIDNDSEEKEDTFDYSDYGEKGILTTQNKDFYIDQEINYGWELSEDGKCPQYCMQCDTNQKCSKCAPHYEKKEDDTKCVKIESNCLRYKNIIDDTCEECESNYILAQDIKDGDLFCAEKSLYDDDKKYYKNAEDSYYKKCDNDGVKFCITCQSDKICDSCDTGYSIVDNGLICGDLSTKLYYQDNNDENKYKSCNKHLTKHNCLLCEIIEENNFLCLECENDYAFFHEELNSNDCISKASKNLNMFYTEDNKNYYPCSNSIANCIKCDDKDTCIDCGSPNHEITEDNKCVSKEVIELNLYYKNNDNKYVSCSKISNCEKCTSADECILCQGDFKLIEGDDNKLTCQNIDLSNYYKIEIEGIKTYYRKCEKDIANCEQCSDATHCTICKHNFGIIDDIQSKCEDLLTEKYYYDDTLEKYKLCSNKMSNCEKCNSNNNNFICKQCFVNYAVKHDINIECSDKLLLENNNNYYSNDSGNNYYSCSLYNDVKNCLECSTKETCSKCESNIYELVNSNTLCVLKTDKESNMYYYNPEINLYTPCSDLISYCNKCYNASNCFECGDSSALLYNDTCLTKEILEKEKYFYKDETTNKYVSCSIMDNCLTCISNKECLSCQEGYKINNNKCEKIEKENNNNKLSTGAIIGIVFGCVGFLLFASLVAFFLYKKFATKWTKKVHSTIANIDEEIIREENNSRKEQNEVQVQGSKRNIHNINNKV